MLNKGLSGQTLNMSREYAHYIYALLSGPQDITITQGSDCYLCCAGKKSGRCRASLRVTPLTDGPKRICPEVT